ncbi:alpha/beta fold hydrolase [Pontivivens insulae]|uniref:Esterase YbfF n=1 Tax=Pontivivens insulae TaxID=1639689 RepID=A0A2R8AA81_9RHOB|nr:alpha/beta fold hydrolase [Pontivivens insulae]RED13019.1 pimeloyl-ACP methyl ester carboxylesterase [Pontivivens insulae]SPF29111.1 Esterase YbfF [Pontivivens insulae]
MANLNDIRHVNQAASARDAGGTPLVIAHGLFGSARNWGAIAKRLSDDRDVIAVDMRNHGDSPHAAPHDYPAMAQDLAEVAQRHGGKIDLLGHSMGGKAAMYLALTQPELINSLIVADIAPVAYDHSHAGHIDVMRKLDLTGVTRRSEADKRLAVHLDDPALRAFLLQSLALDADGPRWKLALATLDQNMPAIVGWPQVEGLFNGPALFIAGGASDYQPPSSEADILSLFPAARFERIGGAGHWVHAEQPRAFVDVVQRFLAE